jgi:hypothetical protein
MKEEKKKTLTCTPPSSPSRVKESPPSPHQIGQLPKQQLHINVKIELI